MTAQWFPDSKSVLINGNEPGKGTRFYVQEVGETGGSDARPVTPEGTRGGRLSPDGKLVLARGPEGKYSVYPIVGGAPQPVLGLAEADTLAQWSTDGRSVLVYRRAEIPSSCSTMSRTVRCLIMYLWTDVAALPPCNLRRLRAKDVCRNVALLQPSI